MNIQVAMQKIKELLEEKGKIVKIPENGKEIVLLKEQKIKATYSASVGVGVASSINIRYFDVRGHIYDEDFRKFSDSSMRIEPKSVSTTKGLSYIVAEFPDGLVRAADEAKWGDALNNLEDFIKVLEGL